MTNEREKGIPYRWVALMNTTLGTLMAAVNSTIVLISLPVIFRGLQVNPLAPGQTGYFLWVLMGYSLASTVSLVTIGRISDAYGKVRFYNMGFVIFTVASLAATLTPSLGVAGELELTIARVFQGIGGAFLFANSAAILTDAFPANQRGLALGVNTIAFVGGNVLGLILGGLLASVNWRLDFLVSVPIGVIGTVWAYMKLKETGVTVRQPLDVWGNVTFGVGLTALMLAMTYALLPYGGASMGWGNPLIQAGIGLGLALLLIFIWVEKRAPYPMFQLKLFRIRTFTAGNLSGFLGSVGRGGLQFMLIIWLQGVWLPLHGVSFAQTPFDAGIDTLPMMLGFLVASPVSGLLSDRYGSRTFATAGMVLSAIGFYLLTLLPPDFSYLPFAVDLVILGIGMGVFAAPNTASIMNSVPAQYRGAASGMRATFQNAATLVSMAVFFTIALDGLSVHLPGALLSGLKASGIPTPLAVSLSGLPPGAALFSALLGYNPMGQLIPHSALAHLSPAAVKTLLGTRFFASLLSVPFSDSLKTAFWVSVGMSLVAAVASILRGGHYVWVEERQTLTGEPSPVVQPEVVTSRSVTGD